jgi:hypothetical protein
MVPKPREQVHGWTEACMPFPEGEIGRRGGYAGMYVLLKRKVCMEQKIIATGDWKGDVDLKVLSRDQWLSAVKYEKHPKLFSADQMKDYCISVSVRKLRKWVSGRGRGDAVVRPEV